MPLCSLLPLVLLQMMTRLVCLYFLYRIPFKIFLYQIKKWNFTNEIVSLCHLLIPKTMLIINVTKLAKVVKCQKKDYAHK